MKKIFAILLTMVMIATIFIGCSKEESEAVNGTTEPETVAEEAVDAVVDELTEDVSVESTTTDENGNEITIGKDADGNTVEVKTNKDGTVTKTVTDKETGKKTEQTTTVAPKPVTTTAKSQPTTKKSETTTKKSTPQTTKKTETTTKKPAQNTTTKPATTKPAPQTTKPAQTTTTKPVHVHKFVTKSETKYENVTKQTTHYFCNDCGLDETEAYLRGDIPGCTSDGMFHMKHCKQTGCSHGAGCKVVNITEKIAVTYAWEECSCGMERNRHKV